MANETDGLSEESLEVIVELQKAEINRLLREQSKLNDRIDRLLTLHEREQVLRQQMQASLDRLATGGGGMQGEAMQGAGATEEERSPVLAGRLSRTERKFDALRSAVGQLVLLIEHQQSRA